MPEQPIRPDFRPPVPAPWQTGQTGQLSSPPDRPRGYAPRPSRLPLLISLGAIFAVALVVLAATLIAGRADHPPRATTSGAPQPTSAGTPAASSLPGLTTEFVSPGGTGRLSVLDHRWETDTAGSALLIVDIQLSCATGEVDYDPFDFQTFDAVGNVYDVAAERVGSGLLDVGVLNPGQAVRGTLAFVMPRGDATLLMGTASTAFTAVRIPD